MGKKVKRKTVDNFLKKFRVTSKYKMNPIEQAVARCIASVLETNPEWQFEDKVSGYATRNSFVILSAIEKNIGFQGKGCGDNNGSYIDCTDLLVEKEHTGAFSFYVKSKGLVYCRGYSPKDGKHWCKLYCPEEYKWTDVEPINSIQQKNPKRPEWHEIRGVGSFSAIYNDWLDMWSFGTVSPNEPFRIEKCVGLVMKAEDFFIK